LTPANSIAHDFAVLPKFVHITPTSSISQEPKSVRTVPVVRGGEQPNGPRDRVGWGAFPTSTSWQWHLIFRVPDDTAEIAKFVGHPGADPHLDPGRHRGCTVGKRQTPRR